MLTPQKMTELVNNKIVDIYTKLNQDLTNEIIKQLKKDKLTDYTKHQLKVLAKQNGIKIFNEALRKTNGITRERKKEIEELFNDLASSEIKGYKSQYDYAGVDYKISDETQQITDSIIRRTNNELKNMTKTIAFETKTRYVQAVDDLYNKVVSGGFSYDKAIKSTLLDLANNGVTLKTKTGNYAIESAVKMNLFTAIKQTADNISMQIKDEIKANAVWIAPTPYCRPTHRPINGVVMDLDKFEKNYEYLTEEANCYHIVNYVVKEAFEPPLSTTEINRMNNKADKVYKDRQKQNYYARQVRQKKKEIVNAKSTPEILKEKKKQLRNAQIKYRVFSKSVNLNVDYSQTWEAGYNGSRYR